MKLGNGVCQRCYLRDTDLRVGKQVLSPFLMSAENDMDPGEVPVYLPTLIQVEEMVIARVYVQNFSKVRVLRQLKTNMDYKKKEKEKGERFKVKMLPGYFDFYKISTSLIYIPKSSINYKPIF